MAMVGISDDVSVKQNLYLSNKLYEFFLEILLFLDYIAPNGEIVVNVEVDGCGIV
jgi:hypothetical protein